MELDAIPPDLHDKLSEAGLTPPIYGLMLDEDADGREFIWREAEGHVSDEAAETITEIMAGLPYKIRPVMGRILYGNDPTSS